jgi:hypothetical protein
VVQRDAKIAAGIEQGAVEIESDNVVRKIRHGVRN